MNQQNTAEAPESAIFDDLSLQHDYATTGQRFANFLIDTVVQYAANYGFFFLLGMTLPSMGEYFADEGNALSVQLISLLLTYIFYALFFTLIEGATKGLTLGKLITGTRAVHYENFEPISWKAAFIRSLCRLVPFEPLSGLGGNPWHDQWSKTTVIKTR